MRVDIQSLRGIAVLLVVFYHAGLPFLKAGYLGVDVFFVISGYLITGMVIKDISNNKFKLSEFYLKRAKRLLPACMVVFLVTTIGAYFFLTATALADYGKQLVGSILFSGNIVLWRLSGYFGSEADLKPLLHMWSLGIEEQFYFFLPFLMMKIPSQWWGRFLIAAIFASFLLCLYLIDVKPTATFYLLPTRAWELGIGALGAYWVSRRFVKISDYWGLIAFILILLVSIRPFDNVHPRLDALVVCLSTLVIIYSRPGFMNQGMFANVFSAVGNISYSLYLVHWPLFAFAKNIYVGAELPVLLSVSLVAVSIFFSWLLYRYVELPFHQMPLSKFVEKPARFAWAGMVLLVIFALPFGYRKYTEPAQDWVYINRDNVGFDEKCNYQHGFSVEPVCQSGKLPKILIWGDSYAMHLVNGVQNSLPDSEIIQVTKASCGPLVGISQVDNVTSMAGAKKCIEFNSSVMSWLEKDSVVEYIILASPFSQYVRPAAQIMRERGGVSSSDFNEVRGRLIAHIGTLTAMGKMVTVFAPFPKGGFDVGLCHERKAFELFTVANKNCDIDKAEYMARQKEVIELLQQVQDSGITVIWPEQYLCKGEVCETAIDGIPLYKDSGHLTYQGSEKFFESISIKEIIFDDLKKINVR